MDIHVISYSEYFRMNRKGMSGALIFSKESSYLLILQRQGNSVKIEVRSIRKPW